MPARKADDEPAVSDLTELNRRLADDGARATTAEARTAAAAARESAAE